MAKKKTKKKWKGTPAQRAALKKGQRALAKWRKEHGHKKKRKVNKKTTKRKVNRKITKRKVNKKVTKRKVTRRNPTPPKAQFIVMIGANHYWDGVSQNKDIRRAARYTTVNYAKFVAQRVADKLKRCVAVGRVSA